MLPAQMSILKTRMIELIEQDRKREYLNLCIQNYTQAVEIIRELYPEYYRGEDPFDNLYNEAMEKKQLKVMQEEIHILETAIAKNSVMPYCYERLAILYSKQQDDKRAYEVVMKWFDSGFWKIPNSATSSLRLLDRLGKLEKKIVS
jgi:tetratricopeptide (TPR) repeat protein